MHRRAATIAAPLVVLSAHIAACGGPATEGAVGAECFRATECQAGLVCVDHKCTSDLSSIDIRAEGGPGGAPGAVDSGAPDGGGTGGSGGASGSGGRAGAGGSGGASGSGGAGGSGGASAGGGGTGGAGGSAGT